MDTTEKMLILAKESNQVFTFKDAKNTLKLKALCNAKNASKNFTYKTTFANQEQISLYFTVRPTK